MTTAQELKEYVSANGAENTTTYLMVQAVSEIERLQAGIAEIKRVLTLENDRPGGPINDTIWRGDGETLFDYIESLMP